MVNKNKSAVTIKVDKYYFENIFEPQRRQLEKQVGRNFSQREFTAFQARSGARVVYPKKIRNINTFGPRRRKGGFGFSVGI